MSEQIVICEPVRTPIGRYGGALKSRTAAELGEIVPGVVPEADRPDGKPASVGQVLRHPLGNLVLDARAVI